MEGFELACDYRALLHQTYLWRSSDISLHARNLTKWSRWHSRPQADPSPDDGDIDMLDEELMQCMESSRITLAGDASILTLQAAGEFILAGTSHGEVCVARWKDRDLQQAGMLKGHSKAVRGLTFSDRQLYSASEDGSVRAWDLRSMKQTQRLSHGGKAGLSAISVSEKVLAAGADDGTLLFWDPRSANLLASFQDTHPEAVTEICFPSHNGDSAGADWMISSSADGFINVMDLKNGLDEDDAFRAALNSTPSVASCGTYGQGESKLWALSQIESLHLWEWAAAIDEEVPGGEGTFSDDLNVRASLAASQQGMSGQPEPHTLIGMSSCEGNLMLASSSATGDVAVFRVTEPDAPGSSPAYTPELTLKGAHKDVVRAMLWPDARSQRYVTAGDDGTIALWRSAATGAPPECKAPDLDPRSKKRQRRA